ncbi:hypothetical protein KTR10_03090 [Candidatus Kaiserbacteria bacterium]|nr:hypothetical protein [Candidatus Kaiserbacteria bacterium]
MTTTADRNIRLLNILTSLYGFRAFEGVLAVYFATISGSFALGMTVLAVINLSASFFEIPTGVLSDAIGRKKTAILHYLASTLSILFVYIAKDTTFLIIGAVLMGLSMALKSGALSAFVYENLEVLNKTDQFKRVEGRRLALMRYALMTAGLCGTLLIYFYTIQTAILLTLIASALALLLSLFLKDIRVYTPDSTNVYSDLKRAWNLFADNRALRNLSLGRIISRGAGNAEYRFRALFFSAIMPEWLVNLLGIINNLFSGVAMHTTHWIVERIGIVRSLVHMEILDRILTSVFVAINTVTSGVLMSITSSITYGTREIASEDLLQEHYEKTQRATMGSLVGLTGSLLYGIVAILLGLVTDEIGLMNTMLLMQGVLLLTPFFFYRGIRLARS